MTKRDVHLTYTAKLFALWKMKYSCITPMISFWQRKTERKKPKLPMLNYIEATATTPEWEWQKEYKKLD